MTRRQMDRTVVAALFAVALAMPVAVRADGPPRGTDTEKARALKAQAEALYDQPKAWPKVARLLEESAALRPADDAEAYECLVTAGRVRATLGDSKNAQRLLEKAAEHALARGMVLQAAESYLDAAFAAIDAHDRAAVAALTERVRLLASSPALSELDRSALLERIG